MGIKSTAWILLLLGVLACGEHELTRKRREIRCSQTCGNRYRSFSGVCNNRRRPQYGAAVSLLRRLIPPAYDDGAFLPRQTAENGELLPSPRRISNAVHFRRDNILNHTNMLMAWGQFAAHDISLTLPPLPAGSEHQVTCCDDIAFTGGPHPDIAHGGNCFPIEIPVNDSYFRDFRRTCINFLRNFPASNINGRPLAPRQQINEVTSFLDASVVYGNSKHENDALRSFQGGRLLFNDDTGNLPDNGRDNCIKQSSDDVCFLAGDERVNEWPGLVTNHNMLVRLHNYFAHHFHDMHCDWTEQRVFQEARKLLIAIMQHITFTEWLPIIIGNEAIQHFSLAFGSYSYNDSIDATLPNSAAAAALRFGHSLIPETFLGRNLAELFNRTATLRNGIDDAANGLHMELAQAQDQHVTDAVRNRLFEISPGNSFDLVSFNIQRGRDHGLQNFNEFRTHVCSLERVHNFLSPVLGSAGRSLEGLYDNVNDIDLFVGMLVEPPVPDGIVGSTLACLLGLTFRNIKNGDSFFYESTVYPEGFTRDQIERIRTITLARIICTTTGISSIQPRAFFEATRSNQIIHCEDIPEIPRELFM